MRSEGSAGSTIQKGQCYNDAWRTSTAVDSPLRCGQGRSGWERGRLQISILHDHLAGFYYEAWADSFSGTLVRREQTGRQCSWRSPGAAFSRSGGRHGGACWGRDLDRIGLGTAEKLTIQLSMPRGRHLHWCVPTRPARIGMELRSSILGREHASEYFMLPI